MRQTLECLVVALGLLGQAAWAAGEAPVAVSPGGAREISRIDARCPTFSWGSLRQASSYELVVYRVGESGEEAQAVLSATLPGSVSSWTPPLEQCLARGGRYAWALRALGDERISQWSEARVFQVSAGPSIQEVDQAMVVLRRYLAGEMQESSAASPVTARVPGPGESEAARTLSRERGSAAPRAAAARPLEAAPEHPLPDSAATRPTPTAPTLGSASISVDGQLHLGAESHVFKSGELLLWESDGSTALGHRALANLVTEPDLDLGVKNTAAGYRALEENRSGDYNTAVGYEALASNDDAGNNTAIGAEALHLNTGCCNSAVGSWSLVSNVGGQANTAIGYQALRHNRDGSENTAVGNAAMVSNKSGKHNTASGASALANSISGEFNTALGYSALGGLSTLEGGLTGSFNTGTGGEALMNLSTGDANTAVGYRAIQGVWDPPYPPVPVTGERNAALGYEALAKLSTGSRNIAVGYRAGFNASPEASDNIFIGAFGDDGDEGTIRIGRRRVHKETYIAGIHQSTVPGGLAVYVTASGKLGASTSSRRFKEEVRELGDLGDRLLRLRPVAFRYRPPTAGGERPLEYGLIAEEVAEVFPELVVFDDQGQPYGLRYQLLTPMLLAELQRQHRRLEELEARLARLDGGGAASVRPVRGGH